MAIEVMAIPGLGFDSNIFIVRAKKAIIVDTGTGISNGAVLAKLHQDKLDDKIDSIILTHRHIDHVGGARELGMALKCPVYAGPIEAKALREGDSETTCAFAVGMSFEPLPVKDLGEEIDIGGETLQVIAFPGHTEGHVVLYHEKSGSLLSGDLVFCGGGVGRWDLPTGSLAKLKKSMQAVSKLKVASLYPGHGPYAREEGQMHVEMALQALGFW